MSLDDIQERLEMDPWAALNLDQVILHGHDLGVGGLWLLLWVVVGRGCFSVLACPGYPLRGKRPVLVSVNRPNWAAR